MRKDLREIEETLLEARADWERRLDAIQSDRRRVNAPLDKDLDDRAIQLENDDTLDALDIRGRQAIASINAALDRLARGTFGDCVECGERISPGRLRAVPTAAFCVACASDANASEEGAA